MKSIPKLNIGTDLFKVVDGSKKIINSLKKVSLKKLTVIMWRMYEDGSKVTMPTKLVTLKLVGGEMEMRVVDSSYEKFKEVTDQLTEVNFYVPNMFLIFQSELVREYNDSSFVKFEVRIPKSLVQIERRKEIRIMTDNRFSLTVEMNKTVRINRNCYDISSGGFSIVVGKSDVRFFQEGDHIKGIKLCLEKRLIHCNGKIISIIHMSPEVNTELLYGGYKISFKFTDIKSEDFDFINDFIFRYL